MGTVLMEVLAGAADERHATQLARLLSELRDLRSAGGAERP
ncbi:MAG: hypothetical protein WKF40_03660 [Thermoleophilaceae bacterium]